MIFKIRLKNIAFYIIGLIAFCLALCVTVEPSILAVNDTSQSFAIIMYHHISCNPKLKGDYVITPEQLEADFKYLKEKGYKTLSVRDLYSIDKGEMPLPTKSVMITFDDGQESFYKYAFPLLKKYGFCAVLSVIGKYSEQFSKYEDHNIDYSHITFMEIKELLESGIVEIGNHSYDMHSNLKGDRKGVSQGKYESDDVYKNALETDINRFNELFDENVGFKPNIFTYPFGIYSEKTKEIIKQNGYHSAFTCYEKRIVPNSSEDWLFYLGRYNRAAKYSTENFFKKLSVY